MQLPTSNDDTAAQINNLRGLPLCLSGGSIRHLARTSVRVKSLRLARNTVMRHYEDHAPAFKPLLEKLWQKPHPVEVIEPHINFDPRKVSVKGDRTKRPLKGWLLGNVPPEQVNTTEIPGIPDTTIPYEKLRKTAEAAAFTADLTLHSRTMQSLNAREPQQTNQQLAAQVLSQSCPNTGRLLKFFPNSKYRISNNHFVQLLRTRFGVPCVNEPEKRRCNCSAQGVFRHPEFRVHYCEPQLDDIEADKPSFATQPLHGIIGCRRRWRRVIQRHNSIRDCLARALRNIKDVQTQLEPPVHDLGANVRADIKVTLGAQTWLLDVGIVCPASAGWIEKKSKVCPGIAGRTYHNIKHRKYKGKVIPVIIETGGRFDEAGRDFIDKLASSQQDTHQRRTSHPASHAVFNKVALTLEKVQMNMMANLVRETAQPDAAAAQPPHTHDD